MKVICTSPSFAKYDARPLAALQDADLELICLPADATLSMLQPHLADAVAMIVAFTEINDALLAFAPRLKIVCKHGVGVDNIDLDATHKRGIYVTNVPNANKHAVADFAFSLILGCARQLTQAVQETRAGHWPRIFATDVYGKTIGIVGLGNIGKQVALRASGFNMRILACDAWQDTEFAQENNIEYVSLDFPADRTEPQTPPASLLRALGITSYQAAHKGRAWLIELADRQQVEAVKPDIAAMVPGDHKVTITAPGGEEYDFVSRFFSPGEAVWEDPVTGSAHTMLIPYWAQKLGKNRMFARQVSARGGDIRCELKGDRVLMSGQAKTYIVGKLMLD